MTANLGGRPRGLGQLTNDEAAALCYQGYTRRQLAEAAGVSPDRAGAWRCEHGLSRKTRPTGLPTADKRTYQREWKRLRRVRDETPPTARGP